MKTFSRIMVALGVALVASSMVAAQNEEQDEDYMMMMSSGSVTPVPTSTPTPVPVPTPPNNVSNFTLKDRDNSAIVCLSMTAAFQLNITYTVKSTNKTKNYTLGPDGVLDDLSFCSVSELKANISIKYEGFEDPPFFIILTFAADNHSKYWNISSILLDVDPKYLSGGEHSMIIFHVTDSKLEATNTQVGYTRSFKCSSRQEIKFNETSNIYPVLYVENLEVQVFSFKNTTTGAFTSPKSCSLDSNKGNKIVPIAVGAALAGLVIVVLIAYLVGRLRSRRQSSYEALS